MYGAEGLQYDRYLGAIRYMDAEIDRVLRELARRGALERTVVVITSDHGESFREHGLVGHGNGLYLNQVRVPLVIAQAPGTPRGVRVQRPVSLRDLGATIVDLAAVPAGKALGGQSLLAAIRAAGASVVSVTPADTAPVSTVFAEVSRGINIDPRSFVGRADQKTLITDSLHIIGSNLNTLQVFRPAQDSLELHNLSGDSATRAQAADLLEQALTLHGIRWRSPPR